MRLYGPGIEGMDLEDLGLECLSLEARRRTD